MTESFDHVAYVLRLHHEAQHAEFEGLHSDHVKLLLAGTVLLEAGMRRQRPVYRLHLDVNKENNQLLSTKLRQLGLFWTSQTLHSADSLNFNYFWMNAVLKAKSWINYCWVLNKM